MPVRSTAVDLDLGVRGDLAFFVNVVATGCVLGVDSSDSPEEVTARLGTDSADNRSGKFVWRDYGTVEFFWERLSGATGWRGAHFSIQVHRLSNDPGWMNDMVRRAYGPFREGLRFEELAMALAMAGCELVEVVRPAGDVREFACPATGASILVATEAGDMGLGAGDVWQISCLNRTKAADDAAAVTC